MYIEFKELKFKNFMSYGNKFSTYKFNNGMDLINGVNGSGKSSLVEALTFSLFGKAFRKAKLNSLVNDISTTGTEVHCTFEINKDTYTIIRCLKPNSFEIYKNGELIPQHSTVKEYQRYLENYIIKMNESTFRQLIVLGANISSSKPFLELNSSEKEDVFNTVIDTKIFTYMLDIIKERLNKYKTYKMEYTYKLDLLETSIQSEKTNIANMELKNKEFNTSHQERKEEIKKEILELDEKIKKTKSVIDNIKKIKEVYNKHKEGLDELKNEEVNIKETINSYKIKLKQIESVSKSHSICIGCDNLIKISGINVNEKQEIEKSLTEAINNLNQIKNKIQKKEENVNTLYEGIVKAKNYVSKLKMLMQKKENLNNELDSLNNFKYIDINYDNIKKLEEDYNSTKTLLQELNNNTQKIQNLKGILTDKSLKGAIIAKQLPVLNKYINMYLEKFSTSQFSMIIQEDFTEKIVTSRGVQKEFTQLSNGQKMRLTFSLIFAFLKFIEEKNAITFNVLIADEVLDTSVDYEGREELLDILYSEFSKDKNIIIITHNPEIKEKSEIFNRVINIKKENNFSKMEVQ